MVIGILLTFVFCVRGQKQKGFTLLSPTHRRLLKVIRFFVTFFILRTRPKNKKVLSPTFIFKCMFEVVVIKYCKNVFTM